MRLLYVSTWFPYPPDNGARTRAYNLLRQLAGVHEVHLVTFMPTATNERHLPYLRALCPSVQVVRRDPFRRDPVRALLGYFSTRPRGLASTYSREMMATVSAAIQEQRFDAVIASTVVVAPYALAQRQCRKILEEQNFLTRMMWERYKRQHDPLRRLVAWLTWRKSARYETLLFRQFDAISMVSEVDRAAVVDLMPDLWQRVSVIPNGVDLEYYSLSGEAPLPNTLIYSGPLVHNANLDAMNYFLREILPAIQAELPDVSLTITGLMDGVSVRSLPLSDRVTLSGYVDDIRPLVRRSWACVVPLRIGGGTRLKLLEALALGTPVISTTKGAEGLGLTPGREVLVADDPAAFAAETVRLLRDRSLRDELAKRGRALVEREYSWDSVGSRLNALLDATAASEC